MSDDVLEDVDFCASRLVEARRALAAAQDSVKRWEDHYDSALRVLEESREPQP